MSDIPSFDYVVVGGGSSGCIVAARLAEDKQGTVLLLEAGEDARNNPETMTADGFKDAFANDRTMWDRMTQKQDHVCNRPLYFGSGTGMGGSGSVNGMVYTRGDKLDYAQWPKNWKWNKVSPIFKAIEKRLNVQHREASTFTETCINAATKVGFERKNGLNDGSLCGYIGYNDMNFQGDQRRSSYTAFIHGREKELSQLTIETQSKAQQIIFDDKKTAVAVEYLKDGELQCARVNKEVIMCAGALETPKLLMLSGIGPQRELNKLAIPKVQVSEGIGKNLHDHPNVCVFYQGRKPIDFSYPQLYGFHRANDQLDLPEDQADTCYVVFSAPSALKQSMKRMLPIMALPGDFYNKLPLRNAIRKMVDIAFKLPLLEKFVSRIYGIVVILGKPMSKGTLTLNSRDPNVQANIDPAYYQDPRDLTTMIKGVELANQIAQQWELKAWGNRLLSRGAAGKDRKTVRHWIEGATMTTFHYSGSCSMGESDEQPVDLDLKLKGINNVRVADASVIPEVPVSAINAPSMMIGYRAAQFIIDANASSTDKQAQPNKQKKQTKKNKSNSSQSSKQEKITKENASVSAETS